MVTYIKPILILAMWLSCSLNSWAMDPKSPKWWNNVIKLNHQFGPTRFASGEVQIEGHTYQVYILYAGGMMIFDGPLASHVIQPNHRKLRPRPVYLNETMREVSDFSTTFKARLRLYRDYDYQLIDPDYPAHGLSDRDEHHFVSVDLTETHDPSDMDLESVVTRLDQVVLTVVSSFFRDGFTTPKGQFRAFERKTIAYAGQLKIHSTLPTHQEWLEMRSCRNELLKD